MSPTGDDASGDHDPTGDEELPPGADGEGRTGTDDAADSGEKTGATGEESVDRPRVVEGATGREVVVPMRLYKTVTVIATLLAIVGVVGGFALMDAATNRARAPASEVDLPVVLAGLAMILAGALVYVYSTRFRAAGMGKSKAESDEASDDG